MERCDGYRQLLHGAVEDYLYPLLGMERVAHTELEAMMPYDAEAVRDDLDVLEAYNVVASTHDGAIRPVETKGFERIAAELDGRSASLVATEPVAYELGPEGERYVEERDMDALEDSLSYVFE